VLKIILESIISQYQCDKRGYLDLNTMYRAKNKFAWVSQLTFAPVAFNSFLETSSLNL